MSFSDSSTYSSLPSLMSALAGAHLHHLAHLGLFLGGVRQQDAAGGFFLGLGNLDKDAVAEGLNGGNAEGNSSHGWNAIGIAKPLAWRQRRCQGRGAETPRRIELALIRFECQRMSSATPPSRAGRGG